MWAQFIEDWEKAKEAAQSEKNQEAQETRDSKIDTK